MSKTQFTGREFLGSTAALAAFSIVPRYVLARSGQPAPGEKMNIGCVGVGGMQGGNDVQSVSSQNESGRGQPHSKTLRKQQGAEKR